MRKGFNKAAATGAAGFVQKNGFYNAVGDLHALHVLAADVQDKVDIFFKILGRRVMRDGFHLAVVNLQGCFNKVFAVTGNPGAGNHRIGMFFVVDLF